MKKLLVVLSLAALLTTACSDSEPEVAATDAPTTAAETTAAPATEAETSEEETPAAGAEYELLEWSLEGATEITGGSVTFDVLNGGEFPHEFAIARGDSYDSLPQLSNGAVDEEALGDDFLGRTETFDGGESRQITFDLEPGSYVFLCNIAFGPNSHAAAGQVLSVVVS